MDMIDTLAVLDCRRVKCLLLHRLVFLVGFGRVYQRTNTAHGGELVVMVLDRCSMGCVVLGCHILELCLLAMDVLSILRLNYVPRG